MTKFFKKVVVYIFTILFSVMTSQNSLCAYDYDDLKKVESGWIILPFAELSFAYLNYENFNNATLTYASFVRTDLEYASFFGADLYGADFRQADLFNACFRQADLSKARFVGANLTNTNFEWAILWETNFDGASVSKASFYNSYGLTNDQKNYLRQNGAINVPKDLSKEEFEQELKIIAAMLTEMRKNWIVEKFKKICSRLFCCFKNNKL